MPSSEVQVYYRDGSPASGCKVVMGFSGGMSRPGFTDNRGRARVEHASTGSADIYVRGSKVASGVRAPGAFSVTMR